MKDVSNNELLEALTDLHEAVGDRFDKVDGRLADLDHKLERIESLILRDHQMPIEALVRRWARWSRAIKRIFPSLQHSSQ